MSDFRKERDFYSRKVEVETIKRCWPDKIPIILESHPTSSLSYTIKPKFLCPVNFTVQQFLSHMRRKVKMPAQQSLFISTESSNILSGDRTMAEVYLHNKNEDGFLYLKYGEHASFG